MTLDPAQSTLESLHHELAVFQNMLKKLPCRYGWLAELPMTEVGNAFPSMLEITRITGTKNSLRDTAARLASEFSYIDSAQHNKNTRRTAGLIILEAEVDQQIQLTCQCYWINRLKKQLRNELSLLTSSQRKMIRVGEDRRINLVQAYRRVAVFARPARRYSFGWALNSSTIYKTSVAAFKHHLNLTIASSQTTPEDRAQALRDIKVLNSYPDGPLVRRRRIPPTPIVSVSVVADSKTKYFKRAASSPLLAFVEPGQALPLVTPLKDCQIDQNNETRPDFKYSPVLPHRDLYIDNSAKKATSKHSRTQHDDWLNRV